MGDPPYPPPPDLEIVGGVSPEFNDAQTLCANGYDSNNASFKDSGGTPYYFFVGKAATSGRVAWFCRKLADSGGCPQAKIPQATFNVVSGGTLNTSTGLIAYSNKNYLLKIERDGNGVQIAYAEPV